MRQARLWQRGPDGEIIRLRPAAEPSRDEREPAPPTDAASLPGRAKLGLALRLGIRDTYDYLGAVLVMSLLWALGVGLALLGGHAAGQSFSRLLLIREGTLPAQLLAVLGGLVGAVLVGGPLTAGLFRYARNAAARQEPELFDLAWGFREAAKSSIAVAGVQAGGAAVLVADCVFFFGQRNPYWMAVGVVFLYALFFWCLASLYAWPLLAEHPASPGAVLKKAALLVLDNAGFSLGLGLVVALLGAALWATVVGGMLLWAGALAIVVTQAARELLRKYGLLPPDPTLDPIAEETGDTGGYGWRE